MLSRALHRNSFRFLLVLSGLIYAFGWVTGFFSYGLFPFEPSGVQVRMPGVIPILIHNLRAMAPLAAGIVTFGISTLLYLIFNGITAGYAVVSSNSVLTWAQIGLRILPHGIFEIPATLLWGTVGFSSIWWLFALIRGIKLGKEFWVDVIVLLATGGALLVVAAVIEGTISSKFILVR